MNVLYITPNSPFLSVGGVERYILNLADYYHEQTDRRAVIMIPTNGKDRIVTKNSVVYYHTRSLSLHKDSSHLEVSARSHKFVKAVEDAIAKFSIDIISAENFHIGLPPAYSMMLNMVGINSGIPLILRLHSFSLKEIQSQIVSELLWDKVSCVSRSVAGDSFMKGVDINKLATHYLGVNRVIFNPNNDKKWLRHALGLSDKHTIILTASRIIRGNVPIIKEKGLIDIMEAFSKLVVRYPQLRLVIAVGKATIQHKDDFAHALDLLIGHATLFNIKNKVFIHMYTPNQMPEVYAGSDIFVLPSENETFGQVFIEAMASGLPVIGTKVGGIPEIINDGYNGFLIPPSDPISLSKKIELLLRDPQFMKTISESALESVQSRFAMRKLFASYDRDLEKIINTRSSNQIRQLITQ